MLNPKVLCARWRDWHKASVNRSILNASLTIALFTLLVKAMTAVKDMVVVANFGLSDSLDVFLSAYILPLFAISVFGGSFHSALIPVLTEVDSRDDNQLAKRLFANVSLLAFLGLTLVTIFFYVFDDYLIHMLAFGFDEIKINQSKVIFDQMLPLILIGGMTLCWGAVLNTHEKFILVAVAPIFTPLLIILGFYLTAKLSALEILVQATLLGTLVEFCTVVYGLYKLNYFDLSVGFGWDASIKKVLLQYVPMISGAFIMSGTVLVDQAMASMLPSGSVSALNYANKVPSFIFGLAATAIGTAVLPFISRQVIEKNFYAMKNTLIVYSKIIIFFTTPIALIGIFFSHQMVEFLFERKSFDVSDTQLVSQILSYSMLQVPLYILGTLYARAASVLIGNKVLFYIAVLNIVLDVVLNYIFMKNIGVAGIALSTSVVYFFSTVILALVLNFKIKELRFNG